MKLEIDSSGVMTHYSVFEHSLVVDTPLDGYEISDLTIDCNLGGQPTTSGHDYPRIAVGAVALMGRNILIRRVRVINFGTNTPASLTQSRECFPIAVAGAIDPSNSPHSSNCVVEDCILEQPALNNARETTCISMTSGETTELKADYHDDCVIRNCYINCEYVRATATQPALRVKSITTYQPDQPFAVLETYEKHGMTAAGWIVVSGATDPGGGAYEQLGMTALYSGSFEALPLSEYRLTYVMDGIPVSQTAGGEIWLGKAPSAMVTVEAIEKKQVGSNWWVILTTSSPHYRIPGDYALIQGVRINPGGEAGENNRYNGYYKVEAVNTQDVVNAKPSRMFKYMVGSQDPGTLSSDAYDVAMVGANFQGVSADGGRRALVERNRIFNCRTGGPYHDTYNTQSLIVRKNYYYNVNTGLYQNLGMESDTQLAGDLTKADSVFRFTFQSGFTNPFAVGEVVGISKGPSNDDFCGYFEVTAIDEEDEEWFQFVNLQTPGSNPAGTYLVARVYTVQQLWVEDNVIDLALNPVGTRFHATPWGISAIAPTLFNGLPMLRRMLVRGNLIRHIQGMTDPCARRESRGVDVSCCRALIVESNVIGLEDPNWALRHYACGNVKALNNLNFSGEPVYALKWDVDPHEHTPEIRTQAEDLFLVRFR